MNRRGFLRALSLAPVAAVFPAIAGRAAAYGERLSAHAVVAGRIPDCNLIVDGSIVAKNIAVGAVHTEKVNIAHNVIRSIDKRTRFDLDSGTLTFEE